MLSRMPSAWTITITLLASVVTAEDLTWFVDSSCDSHFRDGIFDKMMNEAVDTAQLAVDRLSRRRDQEPQAYNAFKAIFKFEADSNDPEDKDIMKDFFAFEDEPYGIRRFTKETLQGDAGRKASEIRIYCDNGARHEAVRDENGKLNPIPSNQVYKDPINSILVLDTTGCDKGNIMGTIGRIGSFMDAPGEHPSRTTITICDLFLKSAMRYNLIEHVNKNTDLASTQGASNKIELFAGIGSLVMYHELHHHSRHRVDDHVYGYSASYGLDKYKAMDNGYSWQIFGALLWGLERGYALDMENPAEGLWKKDDTIPTRVRSTKKRGLRWTSCKDEAVQDGSTSRTCREFHA